MSLVPYVFHTYQTCIVDVVFIVGTYDALDVSKYFDMTGKTCADKRDAGISLYDGFYQGNYMTVTVSGDMTSVYIIYLTAAILYMILTDTIFTHLILAAIFIFVDPVTDTCHLAVISAVISSIFT